MEETRQSSWNDLCSIHGFASFGIGCATQVNAIANVVEENTGVQGWMVGLVVAILTAIVIFGGIKSIATVCENWSHSWLSFT